MCKTQHNPTPICSELSTVDLNESYRPSPFPASEHRTAALLSIKEGICTRGQNAVYKFLNHTIQIQCNYNLHRAPQQKAKQNMAS